MLLIDQDKNEQQLGRKTRQVLTINMLNFMSQRISKRRIKKGLRRLEKDLGQSMSEHSNELSSEEFLGKLDFWISYYVTWLIRATDQPEDIWCDGSTWSDNQHQSTLKESPNNTFTLKCNLDIQDDNRSYSGELTLNFQFDQSYTKFIQYYLELTVCDTAYHFSSDSKKI